MNFFNDSSYTSTFHCTLRNALIVPGLRTPLISTAALIDDDACPIQHFEYSSLGLSGTSANGQTLLYGFRERRRYFIPFDLQDDAMFSSTTSSQEETQPSKSGPEEETGQQAQPFQLRSSNNDVFKLHLIFSHASLSTLRELTRRGLIQLHPNTKTILNSSFTNIDCSSCKIAKATKLPLPSQSSPPLSRDDGIWHFDIKGPLVDSVTHYKHVGQATHAKSDWSYPFYLRQKSEAMAAIEELKGRAERDGHPIKTLRLDYGGELHCTEFEEFAKRHNIQLQHSSPNSSEQNGMAERPLRTLSESAAANLLQGNLHRRHWPDAWNYSNYTKNRIPSSTREFLTPFEIYHGRRPDMHKLAPFGCAAYSRTPDQQRYKADITTGRARACVMIGYDETTKDGYKLINLSTNSVIHSRSVTFIPDDFPLNDRQSKFRRDDSDAHDFSDAPPNDSTSVTSIAPTTTPATPTAVASAPAATATSAPSASPITDSKPTRKSNRVTWDVNRFSPGDYDNCALSASSNHDDFEEPSTITQAMKRHDWKHWKEAIVQELRAHRKNQTWRYSRIPQGRSAIGSRFVFKRKRGPDGSVLKYKARLVAQGFSQRPGIDFKETFSPTPGLPTIRHFLAQAVLQGLDIHLADIDTAYLIPKLPQEERAYMRLPDLPAELDLHIPADHVAELLKCLYGLKQSGRHWNRHLRSTLNDIGFIQSSVDPCLYKHTNHSIYILIYVDDILIAAKPDRMHTAKIDLKKRYVLKDLGRISWYLGMSLHYDFSAGELSITQSAYVESILAASNMTDCSSAPTPIVDRLTRPEGTPTQEEQDLMDRVPYSRILGMLIWLSMCTRFDIVFAVNQLSRFSNAPRLVHWKAMKRLIRYLSGTRNYGLLYAKKDSAEVVGYSDADWGGEASRRSTSGVCFTLAGCAISWRSKTQRVVALSTAESELIALTEAVKEAARIGYLTNQFSNLEKKRKPLLIHCDNQAAIAIASEARFSDRTKHIDIRYFYCRDKIEDGTVSVHYIATLHQLADLFTKPTARIRFQELLKAIGMHRFK